jgi:electron transfer flavoprotein beta subunit
MNILVCVRAVFSPQGLQPPSNGSDAPAGFLTTNRADECAIQLASRLLKKSIGELTLVSVSGAETKETLDFYVGLGANGIIRVSDQSLSGADAGAIAFVLAQVSRRVKPDLILSGDRAIGGEGSGLTGPLLAELLGWPFLGSLVEVELSGDTQLTCVRLIERGDRQIFNVSLPAVLAASPEVEGTRYPAYKRTRQATHQVLDLNALGVTQQQLDGLVSAVTNSQWTIAKPKPRKLFTPPSTASAADRMNMIMRGGQTRKPQSSFVEGTPDKVAEQILQFLRQERLI